MMCKEALSVFFEQVISAPLMILAKFDSFFRQSQVFFIEVNHYIISNRQRPTFSTVSTFHQIFSSLNELLD